MKIKNELVLLLLLAAPGALACAPTGQATVVPESASAVVLSLQGIDCQSCGDRVVGSLTKRPGVYAASFDKALAEVSVQYDPAQIAPTDMLAVIEGLGYQASEGAGKGAYIPEIEFDEALDVKKVSKDGQSVVLQDHLAPGKVTVVDFYAVWCKPCREVDHHMKQVLAAHGDVALRKVDVVDWDSEAAKEHLRGVPDLPYVIVFGPSGKQVAAISGLRLDELDAAIDKARTR